MLRRSMLVACLVAVLGAAALLAGAAFASTSGSYTGLTDQHGPIKITVRSGTVTSVYIGVVGDCSLVSSGTQQWTYTFHAKVKIKSGKLEYHTIAHDYAIDLSARLQGKTIKGRLQAANPNGCLTPQIAFSARK